MGDALDKISIKGFRSIRELTELPLSHLNVLVGANGTGKSNFVDFFRMLRAMYDGGFQRFIVDSGGGDSACFNGPKVTKQIAAHLAFGENEYRFELTPTPEGRSLMIASEGALY